MTTRSLNLLSTDLYAEACEMLAELGYGDPLDAEAIESRE